MSQSEARRRRDAMPSRMPVAALPDDWTIGTAAEIRVPLIRLGSDADRQASAFALRVIAESYVTRERANTKPLGRWPNGSMTRPYADWRAEEDWHRERADWLRLISHGVDVAHHARNWNYATSLYGRRTQSRVSGWVALIGEVAVPMRAVPIRLRDGNMSDDLAKGAYTVSQSTVPLPGRDHSPVNLCRDPGRLAPSVSAKDPVPDSAVRVTFPDWAGVATLPKRGPNRAVPTLRAVSPMASVYAARQSWQIRDTPSPLRHGMIPPYDPTAAVALTRADAHAVAVGQDRRQRPWLYRDHSHAVGEMI